MDLTIWESNSVLGQIKLLIYSLLIGYIGIAKTTDLVSKNSSSK